MPAYHLILLIKLAVVFYILVFSASEIIALLTAHSYIFLKKLKGCFFVLCSVIEFDIIMYLAVIEGGFTVFDLSNLKVYHSKVTVYERSDLCFIVSSRNLYIASVVYLCDDKLTGDQVYTRSAGSLVVIAFPYIELIITYCHIKGCNEIKSRGIGSIIPQLLLICIRALPCGIKIISRCSKNRLIFIYRCFLCKGHYRSGISR